jgi:methylthioribulose-1-phosphate dehydratase
MPIAAADFPNAIADLIETGRDFHRRGWSLGTSSNYSVVVDSDPVTLLMTTDHFLLVDENAGAIGDTALKPSAEALLHTALAKHGAGSILHTHSIAATVLGDLFLPQGALRLSGYEMLKGLSGITTHESEAVIEIFPNTQEIASLAETVEGRLADATDPLRHGFLLAGHGLYTWGRTLAEARRQIEVLEFLFEVVTQKRLLTGTF